MLKQRSSGILMHITSVPSPFGIGDFGPATYAFVDFLEKAGQNCWQILPLNHTTSSTGHSPYSCYSAFAGNPLLISPVLLRRAGLVPKEALAGWPRFPAERVDFQKVAAAKRSLLKMAFERFQASRRPAGYDTFCTEHRRWLEPFATYVALKRHFRGRCWSDWPAALRDRKPGALTAACTQFREAIERERFLQWVFYTQFLELKTYCHDRGIQLIGDLPIYVTYDSADVWSHPEVFKLTRSKRPRFIAGVPPDYFSKTGQLWGNPVYDWDYARATGFDWWMRRMRHNLLLFDLVRIDHFRGLVAYWEVPAGHKTAQGGRWVDAPADEFMSTLFRHLPAAAIFAEDLGYITADVREVVAQYHLPCMRVLHFALGGDPARNPHMPHNHIANAIVYTGTHDNNTTRGWFEKELTAPDRKRLAHYLGRRVTAKDVAWEMARVAMASVAKLAIIPMQDVLGLGATARMNHPAKTTGNWRWRMRDGQLSASLARRLRELTALHGRL
ncbi:MAG: 4-alpha-glucanotransferase [Phycisphaerales bacterium]|nr:MAG: 4-alpha-glucanotransferase [Phycisphaerales bacterium]